MTYSGGNGTKKWPVESSLGEPERQGWKTGQTERIVHILLCGSCKC